MPNTQTFLEHQLTGEVGTTPAIKITTYSYIPLSSKETTKGTGTAVDSGLPARPSSTGAVQSDPRPTCNNPCARGIRGRCPLGQSPTPRGFVPRWRRRAWTAPNTSARRVNSISNPYRFMTTHRGPLHHQHTVVAVHGSAQRSNKAFTKYRKLRLRKTMHHDIYDGTQRPIINPWTLLASHRGWEMAGGLLALTLESSFSLAQML